jgi:hypothetical protein
VADEEQPTPNAPHGYVDGPPPVSLRDRLLVEWVAQAKVGDPLPPPWSQSRSPLQAIIRTLILLGVVERPDPDASLATIARDASAAARSWLEAHPPEPARAAPQVATPPWADRSGRDGSALDIARRRREAADDG